MYACQHARCEREVDVESARVRHFGNRAVVQIVCDAGHESEWEE